MMEASLRKSALAVLSYRYLFWAMNSWFRVIYRLAPVPSDLSSSRARALRDADHFRDYHVLYLDYRIITNEERSGVWRGPL